MGASREPLLICRLGTVRLGPGDRLRRGQRGARARVYVSIVMFRGHLHLCLVARCQRARHGLAKRELVGVLVLVGILSVSSTNVSDLSRRMYPKGSQLELLQ